MKVNMTQLLVNEKLSAVSCMIRHLRAVSKSKEEKSLQSSDKMKRGGMQSAKDRSCECFVFLLDYTDKVLK